jgi:hypothetical protein
VSACVTCVTCDVCVSACVTCAGPLRPPRPLGPVWNEKVGLPTGYGAALLAEWAMAQQQP